MKTRKIMNVLLFGAMLLGMAQNDVCAQMSGDEVYAAVKKKYGSMTSLRLNVASIMDKNLVSGSVIAQKGNKFVLDLGERKIISNGTTLWNYSKIQNSVVVSNFEDKGQISIEKIFFTYLNAYTSAAVLSERNSKGQKFTVLRLSPPAPDKIINNVTSITLALHPKTMDIMRVSIADAAATQTWQISSLKANPKLADSVFNFSPTAGVQTVDMR